MTGVGNRTPKTKKRPRRAKKGHRRQNAYVRAGVIITFYKENGPGGVYRHGYTYACMWAGVKRGG